MNNIYLIKINEITINSQTNDNSINNNSSYSMQLNQVRNYIMNNGALNTKFKEDVVNLIKEVLEIVK